MQKLFPEITDAYSTIKGMSNDHFNSILNKYNYQAQDLIVHVQNPSDKMVTSPQAHTPVATPAQVDTPVQAEASNQAETTAPIEASVPERTTSDNLAQKGSGPVLSYSYFRQTQGMLSVVTTECAPPAIFTSSLTPQ